MSKMGLRQGDESHWKSCFQGRWFREASPDAGSAHTSAPSWDTNSDTFEHNDSNGIPYLVIPAGQDLDNPSVLDALTRLLESMAGQSAEPGPPSSGLSSAAPSAATRRQEAAPVEALESCENSVSPINMSSLY